MAGVSPVPHDSDAMRSCGMVAGGQQALQHALFQAALLAASHSPTLKPIAPRLKEKSKPHASRLRPRRRARRSGEPAIEAIGRSGEPSLRPRLHLVPQCS
ncbi:hypothetical protein FIU66_16085 (plasmid) [Paracoccus sp. AK26]|nr:hypothetical protein FIU66_16085 [Paracoccus sp. AK26]